VSLQREITPFTGTPISLLVVGRHKLPAESLRGAISQFGNICVIDDVASPDEAADLVRRTCPDAVLVHVDVLDVAAIDLVSALTGGEGEHRGERPCRVILITDRDDPAMSGLAIAAGVAGYLTTDSTLEEVTSAICYAVLGYVAVSDQHVTTMLRQCMNSNGNGRRPLANLTTRESQVLALLRAGLSTAQIALRLSISQHTARTHIQNVLMKLDVHSRLEAAAYAARHHLA
jgi:two-component system nitrate/nitrite response regulator NarL